MRLMVIASALALSFTLAGCQTAEQSLSDAQASCQADGYRVGSKAYNSCVKRSYSAKRQDSEVASAAAAGAAAGLIGGALIGAAATRNSGYYYRPYYRCRGWGCW